MNIFQKVMQLTKFRRLEVETEVQIERFKGFLVETQNPKLVKNAKSTLSRYVDVLDTLEKEMGT